jgi:hypothetical protein
MVAKFLKELELREENYEHMMSQSEYLVTTSVKYTHPRDRYMLKRAPLMTPEEKEILHRLSSKASRYTVKEDPEEDHVAAKDIYAANMTLLHM